MSLGPCGGPHAETLPTMSFPTYGGDGRPTIIYALNQRSRGGDETSVHLYRLKLLMEGANLESLRVTQCSAVLELQTRFGEAEAKVDPRITGSKHRITFDNLHTVKPGANAEITYLRNDRERTEMRPRPVSGYFYAMQLLTKLLADRSIDAERLASSLEVIFNDFLKHPWVAAELTRAKIASSPILAGTKIARDIVSMKRDGTIHVPGLLGSF